jgi:hypothetical protein
MAAPVLNESRGNYQERGVPIPHCGQRHPPANDDVRDAVLT